MWETEKFRLDCASKGLMAAQLDLRPAAVAVEANRPFLATLDRFAARVGVKRAFEVVMVSRGICASMKGYNHRGEKKVLVKSPGVLEDLVSTLGK